MLVDHVGTTDSFDGAELHFHVQFHSHDLRIVVIFRHELLHLSSIFCIVGM